MNFVTVLSEKIQCFCKRQQSSLESICDCFSYDHIDANVTEKKAFPVVRCFVNCTCVFCNECCPLVNGLAMELRLPLVPKSQMMIAISNDIKVFSAFAFICGCWQSFGNWVSHLTNKLTGMEPTKLWARQQQDEQHDLWSPNAHWVVDATANCDPLWHQKMRKWQTLD